MSDTSPVSSQPPSPRGIFAEHPRLWKDFHYVYPVVSRRARGLSIGINLNIDNACNFDCIYCCVDRSVPPIRQDVDLAQVRYELDFLLNLAIGGDIWKLDHFATVDQAYRRINDIAFSGNGEPTTYPRFDEAARIAIELKQAHGLSDVKIVIITNATALHRPKVKQTLALLDQHGGEVWAKLDAGTQAYYELVCRTKIPLAKVLDNILTCGRVRPIVIQSLFLKTQGLSVSDQEFEAYLDRLQELMAQGCRIRLVQLYTTARQTAEKSVAALSNEHLDRLAARLEQRLPHLRAEVYYGVD